MRTITLGLLLAALGPGALADDLDRAGPYRTAVNADIDVLAAAKAQPSSACLAALDEMHTTDRQLKELTGQAEEGGSPAVIASQKNEIGVARDVMASDLQEAATACRPDAEQTCGRGVSAIEKQCAALKRSWSVNLLQ